MVQAELLTTKTRALLIMRPRSMTYKTIEARTGISPRWLERFAADNMSNCDCDKVQILYTLLSGKPLNV